MNKHIIPHSHKVKKAHREQLNNHRSLVLWFTGLSGSGKSTIAGKLEEKLWKHNYHTYLLDGDNVRHGLNSNLDFSLEDRDENIRRLGEVAKLFVDAGIIVLTAFISPLRAYRERVRNLLAPEEFIEIYVRCPLEVCEQRDIKGLYRKARNGEIKGFTGIDSPYEPPVNPEITLDSVHNSVEQNVNILYNYLQEKEISHL